CLMITMVARDVGGGIALGVSLSGIAILVLAPIYLQRQIDALMAENRISEIEPYARWKANLAWSELNVHMHEIARMAMEYAGDALKLRSEIRSLLNRGEPYDSMTRIFLGLLHFNNRNFEGLILDLHDDNKKMSDHSFEEILYLVRAYLETGRYEEALAAQLALEEKTGDPEDETPEKRANLVISRMIFLAFFGWLHEFDQLMSSQEEGVDRLPQQLRSFWHGVCQFNAGNFAEGEKEMAAVMKELGDFEKAETEEDVEFAEDTMLPFMRKRFFSLVENREFFAQRILPRLQELHAAHAENLTGLIVRQADAAPPELSEVASSLLGWVTMAISAVLMMVFNVEDVVDLIKIGANSDFLVKSGEYFRLFTYQFVHIGWLHLIMNLVALKFFGPPIETIAGWPIFLGIYFFSGIAGGAAAVHYGQPLSAGASGAVLGLLAAAIVFEFFKARGYECLTRQHNFSTLIFILIINLIIGAVEQVVDSSAHIGGLLGGAAIALLLLPVLKSQFLRRLVGFASVWACIFVALFSVYQINSSSGRGFYPEASQKTWKYRNAATGLEFVLPETWKPEPGSETVNGVEFRGPFREGLGLFLVAGEEAHESVVAEFVTKNTREIEQTPELLLKKRKGPEKKVDGEREYHRIVWQLETSGGPRSVVDYLVFYGPLFCHFRFSLGTENDQAYEKIMSQAVGSFYVR
ncbi:MAG TPA: rhomboid family intramembrane serine protease, partial [Candidatus Rifleibacterium sp.]|nr:rhomboid family intramembrane serine protease [Candidatus Rifleibacterium sp.]